jgi:prevent-host-death family protein
VLRQFSNAARRSYKRRLLEREPTIGYVATVATIMLCRNNGDNGVSKMGVMSVRELNANLSKALARAEAGEIIEITRNGKPIAQLRTKPVNKLDDPEFKAAYERMLEGFKIGIPGLSGPATYEERTGRGR